jgi:hypothetical protein
MSLLLANQGGGGVHYTLICDSGAYTYTGQAATLLVTRFLVCEPGAYVYTGQDATLHLARLLVCEPGAYVYTGQDAILTVSTETEVLGKNHKMLELGRMMRR